MFNILFKETLREFHPSLAQNMIQVCLHQGHSDVICLHHYFIVYVISYHNLVPAGEGLYRQCLLPNPIM